MERNTIEPLLTPPSNDMVTSQDAPNYHAERSTVNLNSEVSNPEAYVTEYDLEAQNEVQVQFSGHKYVAAQLMRTAGSPNANVVVPNQTKPQPPPPAVILTLILILILIKTTNPTQQKGRRNNCLCS